MGIHVEALLAAHRPEVQHEQNNHDDIICHEAAAEQAADDVYNNSRDLSIIQGNFVIYVERATPSSRYARNKLCWIGPSLFLTTLVLAIMNLLLPSQHRAHNTL